ncbi:MAG: GrpB family protein [Anaerolineae bacterium]
MSVNQPAGGAARLHPYTHAWRWRFWLERIRLRLSLGAQIVKIEHVGSTAIPGMPAKPVIDLMVVVADLERAPRCLPALERLGYEYRGENHSLCQHYLVKGHPPAFILYLVEPENRELAARIRFRDYLIEHAEVARAYADLKAGLAERHAMDLKAYQDGKAGFVQQVLEMAMPRGTAEQGRRIQPVTR